MIKIFKLIKMAKVPALNLKATMLAPTDSQTTILTEATQATEQ